MLIDSSLVDVSLTSAVSNGCDRAWVHQHQAGQPKGALYVQKTAPCALSRRFLCLKKRIHSLTAAREQVWSAGRGRAVPIQRASWRQLLTRYQGDRGDVHKLARTARREEW